MNCMSFTPSGEEGLLLVVEDAATLCTVLLHAGSNQVLVPGNKEEVIVRELLSDHLFHPGERKASPARSSFKLTKAFLTKFSTSPSKISPEPEQLEIIEQEIFSLNLYCHPIDKHLQIIRHNHTEI
jgi:hypothetical protein